MEVYRRERNCVEDDGPFVLCRRRRCRRRRRRHRVTKEETSRRRQQEDQSKLSHRAEAFREVYFPNVATIENQIRTQSNYTLFLIWFRLQTNLWQAKQKQKQYNKQQ